MQVQDNLRFQVCLGKECLGDAHKKMKKYKLASKCYSDSLTELVKLKRSKENLAQFQNKIKMKQAMCAYYQGQLKKAISIFEDQSKFYSKFNPNNMKVQ